MALTPAGNLKLLVNGPNPTELTTGNAPLLAACAVSPYFAFLKPAGRLLYAK